jgi:hypothetical protein
MFFSKPNVLSRVVDPRWFQNINIFTFSVFVGTFSLLNRIHIPNADPDSVTKINADPDSQH